MPPIGRSSKQKNKKDCVEDCLGNLGGTVVHFPGKDGLSATDRIDRQLRNLRQQRGVVKGQGLPIPQTGLGVD